MSGAAIYLVRGYFFPVSACGSCWRMARMAVGAVNMEEARCSDSTRKNAPGSGVPTGLPCEQTGMWMEQQIQTAYRVISTHTDCRGSWKPSTGRFPQCSVIQIHFRCHLETMNIHRGAAEHGQAQLDGCFPDRWFPGNPWSGKCSGPIGVLSVLRKR